MPLIYVIDGRPGIVDEVHAGSPQLHDYLRLRISELLAAESFIDALPGFLMPDAASQARIGTVVQRLEAIATE